MKTIANIEQYTPTDKEIRDLIQNVMERADLNVVSVRIIADQVYDRFPTLTVTNKGDFITDTIRRHINWKGKLK